MKFIFRCILMVISIAILISCKGVDEISFTGIDNLQFSGVENNTVNFSASIGIYNPSTANFRIREVNLKTSIDGNFIGTLTTLNPVKIKAKTDSTYHTDFSLELANLVTGATSLYGLRNRKQVTVEMQGYVYARSWLAFKKVAIAEKRLIDIPKFSF
jgi:LEA14-like dessication related protein